MISLYENVEFVVKGPYEAFYPLILGLKCKGQILQQVLFLQLMVNVANLRNKAEH